jgi:phenylpyruvate tautomerase PptA (4-oxalocrotonate tautomerase family)
MRERAVPHVLVKLWPGKTEQQKMKLASKITKAVMATLNDSEESVSVAMEEVKAAAGFGHRRGRQQRSTSRWRLFKGISDTR